MSNSDWTNLQELDYLGASPAVDGLGLVGPGSDAAAVLLGVHRASPLGGVRSKPMSDRLFERDAAMGPGLLVLTVCSNGVGKGTRLELYASTHDDCPIEIREPSEAVALARCLLMWAAPPL